MQARNYRGRGEVSQHLFENRKKYPNFAKKCLDFAKKCPVSVPYGLNSNLKWNFESILEKKPKILSVGLFFFMSYMKHLSKGTYSKKPPLPRKLLVVHLEWYFYEDKPNLTWWHGCNILLTKCYIFCQFLFFKNLLFFDITSQYKTKACLKKISLMSSVISHRTYHETIVCLLTLRGNPTQMG